jgi:hypothetical protein
MSRGPGVVQVRIMETLDAYHRLGRDLGWKWRGAGRSFYQKRRLMPDEYDWDRQAIAAYESGRRVEVWMLRRDTGLSAAELSWNASISRTRMLPIRRAPTRGG